MSFTITWIAVATLIPQVVFSVNQSVNNRNSQSGSTTKASACGVPGVPGVPGIPGLHGQDGAKGDQGPAGPPSVEGLKGAQGNQGAKGQQGIKGPKGEQGQLGIQGTWKQCTWKNVNDGRDYGLVKECIFTKRSENSALKVEFNGDYRICCCLDCCKRWYFTFNGVECRHPFAIDGIAHIHVNHGKTDTNIHRTTQIGGYCEGIRKGTVRVGINVGDCVGKKAGSDAYTGWNSVTRIMIEEVPPTPVRSQGNIYPPSLFDLVLRI